MPPDRRGSASSSFTGSFDDWEAVDEDVLVMTRNEEQGKLGEGAGSEARQRSFVSANSGDGETRMRMSEQEELKMRRVLLGLGCLISIGSHYGAYLLGPVKHSLHTSEGSFSALISSFEMSNTITPLISGLLVPKFGAAKVGLISTGIVLVGLMLVVYGQLGDTVTGGSGSIGTMIFGLFIFGLGLAPIAVVQESIILRHNSSTSKTVARSIALGLLFGKFSAFAASYTAQPLSSISPRLPFVVATGLAVFSFLCCAAYTIIERKLPLIEGDDHSDDHGRWVSLSESSVFGDPFWTYIGVCFFAGGWYSTIHLSSSLLMTIYPIQESQAASSASQLLFSSTLLYPVIGWLLDRRPSILASLYIAVPISIASTYLILLFLTPIIPYFLALTPAAIGIGGGPLLLVVVIPRIVERHQASTALGLHKSLEMAGAVLSQTITADILSSSSTLSGDPSLSASLSVVRFLLIFVLAQLAAVVWWWRGIHRREEEEQHGAMEYGLLPRGEEDQGNDGIITTTRAGGMRKGSRGVEETTRGVWAVRVSMALVGVSWLVFVGNLLVA